MSKKYQLGPIEVEPGTRKNELLPVGKAPDGSTWGIPVIVINGVKEGPRLLVTGCVHGDELEAPWAIQDVANELDPKQLAGTFIGVPVVHVASYIAPIAGDISGMRESPIDGKNLNRVAPGRPDGTVTERLAYALCTEVIPRADYHIDLHAGGTRGTSLQMAGFDPLNNEAGAKSLALAKCFPVPTLWKTSPWGKVRAAAREKGVISMSVEVTGQGRSDREDVWICVTGIKNAMKHLGMIDGSQEGIHQEHRCIDTETYIYAKVGGLLRPAVLTGDLISKGQLIGVATDVYGTVLEEFRAPFDGIVTGVRTKGVMWAGEAAFLTSRLITVEEAMVSEVSKPAVTPA